MMQNRTESKSTLQDSPLGCTFDHDFCLLVLLDQIKAFFNFIGKNAKEDGGVMHIWHM